MIKLKAAKKQTALESDFMQLTAIEPRLLELRAHILRHAKSNEFKIGYCAKEAWHNRISGRDINFNGYVEYLSGSKAKCNHPTIKTQKAYDTVHNYLYSLMPSCTRKHNCCQTILK